VTKPVFSGRIIQLTVEQVTLPNGEQCELEVVHHPGGAAVVALDTDGRVCLIHQYRYVAGGWLWELPAGKIDHQEPPLQTGQRELQEEAGVTARDWQPLATVHSSPGIFSEVIHLYLARELEQVGHSPELHEVFEIHWLPFDQAIAMVHQGEITDGKTIIGLLRAQQWLKSAR
jgi:ADP-ribose pyrophosphatase